MQRNNRRNHTVSPILISLLIQLYSHFEKLPVKPPVTIALLAVNILVHILPYPNLLGFDLTNIQQNCIYPKEMIEGFFYNQDFQINRLLLSSIIHADDMHLYYNMLSLSWKGINLERELGSGKFLQLVIFSLIVSHSLMVLLTYTMHELGLKNSITGYNTCAVGFSAVLFSLKYVWNQMNPGVNRIMGIPIPSKYAAWLELVLISVMSPNASFIGHLCGILAGVLYCISDVLLTFNRFFKRRYTYNSGFASNSNYTVDYEIELEEEHDFPGNNVDNNDTSYQMSGDEIRRARLNKYSKEKSKNGTKWI